MTPKLLVATLALVNLLLGASLGITADRTLAGHFLEMHEGPPQRGHGRRGARRGHRRTLHHLATRLDLDADQRERLQVVLAESHRQAEQVFSGVRPQLEALHRETEAQVRGILTPEQLERFESFKQECERKGPPWRRGRGRGGFHDHHGRGPGAPGAR